eukprot:403335721
MDAFIISSTLINDIVSDVEHILKVKELDKQVRPYAVRNSMMCCLINSILEVTKPDRKNDDYLLSNNDDEIEPNNSPLDNFAQNQKVDKMQILSKDSNREGNNTRTSINSPDKKSRFSRKSKSIIDNEEVLSKFSIRNKQGQANSKINQNGQESSRPNQTPLDFQVFEHQDGFNEGIIEFLRARVDSKNNKKLKEPPKKKRGAGSSMFGNQQEELLKKDHTYDHDGNIIEVKNVKTDYLPSISYNSTRVNLNQNQQVQQSDFNKKIKGKLGQLNPNIEYLQKDFNNEINKIFAKENQRIDLSKDNMNMRDAMKPTFGVSLNEGSDFNLQGPEYVSKSSINNKMSKKNYQEKFHRFDVNHRLFKQAPQISNYNESPDIKDSFAQINKSQFMDQSQQNISVNASNRKKMNKSVIYNQQQKIQVLSLRGRQDILEENNERFNPSLLMNFKSNTPSLNTTLNNQFSMLNSTKAQGAKGFIDMTTQNTPKDQFFNQRKLRISYSRANSITQIKQDTVINKPVELQQQYQSIQSQLSSRKQNLNKSQNQTSGTLSTLPRKRMSDPTAYFNISNQVTFLDRSVIQSQMGTRQKLAKINIKQKILKDEYRPDILPSPPVGKSTGHGFVFRQEFTLEEPSINKQQYNLFLD